MSLVNSSLKLENLVLKESTGPATISGYGRIYVSSSDSQLHFIDTSGTDIALGSGGGGSKNYVLDETTSRTLGSDDDVVNFNSSSAVTVTLPVSSSTDAAKEYIIIRSGTGVVTINRSGSDTIDGTTNTSVTLNTQYDRTIILNDGAGIWYTI